MRLVILDTGTLGLLTHPRARPDALACRQWAQSILAAGTRVIVPGIADHELRRELIRARKTLGLRRLDAVRAGFEFDPITQIALDKAAELWAAVRMESDPPEPAPECGLRPPGTVPLGTLPLPPNDPRGSRLVASRG